MSKGGITAMGMTALAALSLALVPVFAASTTPAKQQKKKPSAVSFVAGGFTPAVADPKLAAAFAGRGVTGGTFRFTPSSSGKRKAVQVAVRARTSTPVEARRAEPVPTALSGLAPTAYDLGVAVGWKRFALSGDIAKIDGGLLPVDRESARIGVSYLGKKFTARVQAGAERGDDEQLRLVTQDKAYSLDIGGSYSIARNVDLTGGVRYRIQHDRLEALADQRRDSQAVYIGTAFRF